MLNSRPYGTVFDLDGVRIKISDLELKMRDPEFWKDHKRAAEVSREVNDLKEELGFWEDFEKKLKHFSSLDDSALQEEKEQVRVFLKDFDAKYIKIFLSGRYDKSNAIMHIYAGAGGVDAQDWAGMLMEMYQRYCEQHGLGFKVLHRHFGEQGGIKSASIEIAGKFAYGVLKGESGVHRLVRLSPFSAKSLRHTSFGLVELLPEIEDIKIEINPDDLRVDTFRSSGPGGQNVNKLETAVRITHIPTNTAVSVQSERSQAQNKQKALVLLKSKLVKLLQEHKVKEISELRGKIKDQQIEWGNQIRSYVLHPYKMVKDHRTGVEVSDTQGVLEGGLDPFIEAEITSFNTKQKIVNS